MSYSTQQGLQKVAANLALVGPSTGAADFPTFRAISGLDIPVGGVNAQTGTTYTALPADSGKLITLSNALAVTLTLPASPPSTQWFIFVQSTGAAGVTIARNGKTIDGAASNLSLTTDQGVIIFTDGSNYFTERGIGSGSSSLSLEVDGTPNVDQTLLNLIGGTNITLTDDGAGGVTIDGSTGTLDLETDGVPNGDQSKLNLVAGTNVVLTDDGVGNVTIDASGGSVNVAQITRKQSRVVNDGSTTTFQVLGDIATITAVGGGSGANAATSAHSSAIGSNGSPGNSAGMSGNVQYRGDLNPSYLAGCYLERITDVRAWVCLTSQTIATMTASDNPAGDYMGFRFSTVAGDTSWKAITKDAATQTITSTGVAPVANTGQTFGVYYDSGAATVYFYINGSLVATHTTHLPTSTVNMRHVEGQQTIVSSTSAGFDNMGIIVEQDFF